jgi:HEAT repeat protein
MRAFVTIGLAALLLGGSAGNARAQSKDPVKDLIALLKDDNVFVRRAASYALISMPENDPAIPALIKVLGDKDGEVRDNAVMALSLMYPHDVVVPLGNALKDPDARTRRKAAETLGRVRRYTDSAMPNLILLLKDKDRAVRRAAAKALREINGPPVGEIGDRKADRYSKR